uniref:Amino acid permease/ SLC12A domain-containing protein n=1 Tax=Bionectria ochroleuca TaxID=29856 RepID=A0A0B7JZR1_BIOOC
MAGPVPPELRPLLQRQDNEPSRSSSPSSSTTARDSEDGDKRPETRVIQEEDIITGDVHPTRAVEDDVLPEISSLGRTLTWQSAFIIVMSRVIGSGIFATPGVILRSVGSPGLTLVLWLVGAVIAACGLSVSLEYGCMLPRSGGEKVYLEFTYRHPRFLASTLVAIQAVLLGFTASNCVVFSQYVLFALGIDHPSEVLRKGLAAGLLVFVTVTHGVFPKTGIRLQNILGWVKIAIVGFMILSGIYVLVFRPGTATTGSSPPVSDQLSWDHVWEGSVWNWGTIATSFFKVLYSFAGLDNVSNVLNEVKEPVRTLKSVTTAALFTTCGLYILINLAYLLVVPVDEIKQSGELIAALFFERIFGHGFGKTALPLAVALSAVGNVLVVAFAQARLKQEIARQGFLPYSHLLSSTKPFGSPLGGFVVHFIPSLLVIVLPPSAEVYSFILELEGYPGQIFSFAICSGLLLLRFKRPDLRRPFKAWTPAVLIKIALSVALLAAPFFPPSQKPANGMFYATYAIVGVSILVAGVIYWYLWTVLIPRWRGYTLEEETEHLSTLAQYTDKRDVRTILNYHKDNEDGSPPRPTYVDRPDSYERPYSSHDATIHDVRGEEHLYTLDKNGFEIYRRAAAEKDFVDDEHIKAVYYPETEQLLKDATGASRIFIFDHTIRRNPAGSEKQGRNLRGPVQRVHIDQSYSAAKSRVPHHLPEEADALLRGRYQIINVWRPIRTIQRDPLAVAEAHSVLDTDLVGIPLIYPTRSGETYAVKHNEGHRWFYKSGLEPDEVILIKCFDSKTDGRARREDAPARESIEVRALVFHPDDQE